MFNINSATLSGCMDIVCVQQPDGSFKSSPFHVRFGKLKLLKSARKTVAISVNGVEVPDVTLMLGQEGEAFFFREAQDDEVADMGVDNKTNERDDADADVLQI